MKRSGVSLLEVLIGIFVLAIGILSVASLIPLAQSQVHKATIMDRVTAFGQNAHGDAQIRGFYQTFRDGTDAYTMFMEQDGTAVKASDLTEPVVIDPLGILAHGASASLFPHTTNVTTHQISRLTLRRDDSLSATAINQPIADTLLFSKDELTFTLPDDEELRPVGGFNSAGTRRTFDPRYSYLITLVPSSGGQFNATYVMFRNRDLEATTDEEGLPLEQGLKVETGSYTAGNSHVKIESTSVPMLQTIRRDDWVMLGGMDKGNNPTFRWYRIRFAEDVVTGSPNTRIVDLGATDWEADTSKDMSVTLARDVVGVYERTVSLEGSTPWSN